ncbi:MAG: amidohydrolase, partial [Paenibacillus sp.]|nr:amidohydrolase [Paenibacillus sp.]
MQTTESAAGTIGGNDILQNRAVIDCDIHHFTGFKAFQPYLPRAYAEFITTYGAALPNGAPYGGATKSASDVATLQKEHLDVNGITYGMLTGESYGVQGTGNYDYAAAICSAINDYTAEQWLSADKRLKGSILVAKQAPHLAAQEIDRLAPSGNWAQVIISNGALMPYGNRYYDPIYEACVRHNLPLMIHAGMEGAGINSPTTGAGYVTHLLEWRASRTQAMMAHLASFIFEGTLERFPELRIVLNEGGVFWIAPYLWRLDVDWKSLRVQTPWVTKLPSEYFRKHFRVTTQSMEPTPDEETFNLYMNDLRVDDTMMACSNYPYASLQEQVQAWPAMKEERLERILYRNAAELYG